MYKDCVASTLSTEREICSIRCNQGLMLELQGRFIEALHGYITASLLVEMRIQKTKELIRDVSQRDKGGLTPTADRLAYSGNEDGSDLKLLNARLTSWLELQHRTYFLMASVHHQLKELLCKDFTLNKVIYDESEAYIFNRPNPLCLAETAAIASNLKRERRDFCSST